MNDPPGPLSLTDIPLDVEGGGAPATVMAKASKKHQVSVNGRILLNVFYFFCISFNIITFTLYYVINYPIYHNYFLGVQQVQTISGTGMYSPEMYVFTYELHLLSVLLVMIFSCLYAIYTKKICELHEGGMPQMEGAQLTHKQIEDIHDWNWANWVVGLGTALLMSLVGTVTLTASLWLHGVFALLMFLGGVLHMLLNYFFIFKHFRHTHPVRQRVLHRLAVYCVVPFNIAVIFIAAVVYFTCDSHSCVTFVADVFPVLEFATVLYFFFYLESLRFELQTVSLVICQLD